jgi:two-component system chemotaxis sensor kinase CheA
VAVNPEDYKALFLEESQGQLTEWEDALLALERNPQDSAQLHRLLRAVHTLKGTAGFVDCGDLQTLAHQLESAVTGGGEEEPEATPEVTGLLFDGLDGARAIMEAFAAGRPTTEAARGVREKLSRLLADRAHAESEEKKKGAAGRLFRIGIHIEAPSAERYLRALLAQTRLEELGTIVVVRPTLEELRMQDAEFEYGVVIQTEAGEEELARALSIDQVKVLHIKPHKRGESACPEPAAEEHDVSVEAERGLSRGDNIVRVPASKLDAMLNLVGELVVQNAGFISLARDLKSLLAGSPLVGSLEEKTEMLSRIARQLQDAVMKVRMLPAATVFSRFPRVIRDLSKSTGKEIRLQVTGAETEIDKKVIDRMSEPLVHLVRNAADHGLETGEERRAGGKDPVGLIRLSAFQEGDRICVEVSDDGRGLDRQRIIDVALERQLVRPEEAPGLSDDAVTGLIFLPGFSTAAEISDISGRGVGLDVVRKFVEDMDGSLRVRTEPGLGTTMTIALPLTMAIIRAILVEDSGLLYAIPLSAVSEVVTIAPGSCTTVRGDKVIMLREEMLPVVPLRAVIQQQSADDIAGTEADPSGPVIIVKHASRRVGLGVGTVIGSSEVVIKSLGRHYQEVEGLLGVSILGNGRMAMILDVGVLLEMHFTGKADATGRGRGPQALTQAAGPAQRNGPAPAQAGLPSPRTAAPQRPAKVKQSPPPSAPAPVDSPAAEPAEEAVEYDGRFVEILSDGAIAASQSLSELLHENIRVTFPELKFVPLADVAGQLGGEDRPVVRVYVELAQGVVGGHLLVIPLDRALHLCDGLLQREHGSTTMIGEEELSGLSELGNVLSAAFLNCIANRMGTGLSSEVPDIRVDMCLSAIDSILARFHEPGNDILMTTTEVLAGEDDQTVCHMLLFLDRPSLALLQGSVGTHFAARADG